MPSSVPTFSNILCPVDFSEGSNSALSYAVSLALEFDAKLWLLNVGDFREHDSPASSSLQDVYQKVKEERRAHARSSMAKLVGGLIEDHPSITVESVFRSGTPHETICKAAVEFRADLIVMGTQGLSGLSRFMIGSTAERVVRASTVPVLTVRKEQ